MIQGDPNIFSVDLSRDANTNDLRKAIEGERKLGLLKGTVLASKFGRYFYRFLRVVACSLIFFVPG
jgi:hypothetical protein